MAQRLHNSKLPTERVIIMTRHSHVFDALLGDLLYRNPASPDSYYFNESDDSYSLSLDLPGVKKEDVSIDLDGDILKVTAERKVSGSRKYDFSFKLGLRDRVDLNKLSAKFEDGILQISFFKVEEAKPKKIEIK